MKFKTLRRTIEFRNVLIQVIQILIGTVIISASITFFLLPNQISTGGFSGVATIIYYLFKIPMGFSIIILNIPLFIIAFIKGGKKYFFSALLGTILLSIFLNLFQNLKPFTQDRLLAAICGGIATGIGSAIILKAGASTGGTELLANIVRMFKPDLKTSMMMVIFDAIVVGLNVMVFRQIEVGLYSAVAIYIMGKVLDVFFEGIDFAKMVFIISPKNEQIAKKIGKDLKRGVTAFYGKGMHEKEKKEILFCVASRGETRDIRRIAKGIDPCSFIVISNAREVFGEGFKEG